MSYFSSFLGDKSMLSSQSASWDILVEESAVKSLHGRLK
jgi:hypothetical protein